MKCQMTFNQITEAMTNCALKINALKVAAMRLNGDRDYLPEKRVLENMKEDYEKELKAYQESVKTVLVDVNI